MLRPRTEEKKSLMPEACPGLKPVEEEEEEGGQRTDRRDGLFRNESSCDAAPGAAFGRSRFREFVSDVAEEWNDKRGKCRGFHDRESGRWHFRMSATR